MMNSTIPVNEYESQAWRPLTFAERRVNLVSIKENMKRLGDKLDTQLLEVKNALLVGKGAVPFNIEKKLTDIVTEIQKESFDFGKQTASSEMKTKVKPTNKKIEGVMRKQNSETIKRMLEDINDRFKEKGYQQFSELSEEFSEAGIFTQFFNGLKSLFVIGAINLGRESVFESNGKEIYAYQFSAILDDVTTVTCRGLDGTIVKPGSKEYFAIKPPRHWNCRSIMVAIFKEDPFKPRFTKEDVVPADKGTPPTIEKLDEWRKKQDRLLEMQNAGNL